MDVIRYLESPEYSIATLFDGDFGDAFRLVAPVIEAYEHAYAGSLDNVNLKYRDTLTAEIETLQRHRLRKIIRITNPRYHNEFYDSGYQENVDASRKSREYGLLAAVLQMYIDIDTNECIDKTFDEYALITIGTSCHVEREGNERLDYFYIDSIDYKAPKTNERKERIASEIIESAADKVNHLERRLDAIDEERAYRGHLSTAEKNDTSDNYLGALFMVLVTIIGIPVLLFLALPRPLQIIISLVLLVLALWGLQKLNQTLFQEKRKKKILRYSDALLRDSIYTEVLKENDETQIGISVGSLYVKSLRIKKGLNVIKVVTTLSGKFVDNGTIVSKKEKVTLTLQRSRYPERKRNKGIVFKGDTCPCCGQPFHADEKQCCRNCGYGLILRRFAWSKP